jgi:trehalose 6-phosphate synthase/phosphatase
VLVTTRFVTFPSLYLPKVSLPFILQTDEDMFRALKTLFPSGVAHARMLPPVSAKVSTTNSPPDSPKEGQGPVDLALSPEAVFSTTVGASSKRTLANWHVTTPQEIVDAMLGLVGGAGGAATIEEKAEEKSNL